MSDSATRPPVPRPITSSARVREVADAVADAGLFTLDLEFLSEDRYVPELALMQVGWGNPEEPQVALLDPLEVDVGPVVERITDPDLVTVFHAGQQDFSLLGDHFEVTARGVFDSQIAAAFLGLGAQMGYTSLIEELLGVSLDKAHQFTDWLQRPLTADQLRYAADDVRWLLPAWHELQARLAQRDRLAWVREETQRLAERSARRTPPEEAYRGVKKWDRLKPHQLGALKAAAAWREREALETNTPPSWIIKDRPLLEVARHLPKDLASLAKTRDVSQRTVRKYGRDLLEALGRGIKEPVQAERTSRRLSKQGRSCVSILQGLIRARCQEVDLAPRFVATRSEVEDLVRWWLEGDRDQEPDLPVLQGWRRDLAGQPALDWLQGRTALAVDEEGSGLRPVRVEDVTP